jgi:AmmeMemoRadiSam system protein A
MKNVATNRRKSIVFSILISTALAVVAFNACGEKEAEMVEPEEAVKFESSDEMLLFIARRSVKTMVRENETYEPPVPDEFPELLKESGVFVTLEKQGDLRGCIGYVFPVKPLYLGVRDNAISAAVRDPRFPPVSETELPELDVEISIMTPLEETDWRDIRVGRDGLYIEGYGHGGLLLPQVATDLGWDEATFLTHVCYKAGLPADAYKDPEVKLYRFQARVFGGSLIEKPA